MIRPMNEPDSPRTRGLLAFNGRPPRTTRASRKLDVVVRQIGTMVLIWRGAR
jgi:hypothetical protein